MRVVAIALLTLTAALAGCADSAPTDGSTEAPDVPPAPEPAPGVDIRLPNGTDVNDVFARLAGSVGTYYNIGSSTFEPTIGATSTGALFMIHFRGLGAGTAIRRSMDQGQTWEDVTPTLPTGMKAVPNSNDPFLYVDPWTDRVYDFDMCIILSGFCVSYSDDDGETWLTTSIATGFAPALDHQSLAAAPATEGTQTVGYPNVLTWCVNRGPTAAGSWCSSSFDGGIGWTPLVPGFPMGTPQCSGLSGHVTGSIDGNFYRGNPSCGGPAVYRSEDGGLTWTEHTIPTDVGVQGHEIATATDEEGNVYAFWISSSGLPQLAISMDQAESWNGPFEVGAADVTAAGFPTVAAGGPGQVAFAYIGTDVEGGYQGEAADMDWTGYLGIVVDGLNATPSVANVPVNDPSDPLDTGRPCGAMRCGGFGDFIDIVIDGDGRPWAALAHNEHDSAGIVGTLATGPSLRGNGTLEPLPAGGATVWA